jgi:hypothetical protein
MHLIGYSNDLDWREVQYYLYSTRSRFCLGVDCLELSPWRCRLFESLIHTIKSQYIPKSRLQGPPRLGSHVCP